MLAAQAGFVVVPLGLVAVVTWVIRGLAVTAVRVFGAMFNAASYAMVADLLPPMRCEVGYASVRVANDLGVCFGLPLGGLAGCVGADAVRRAPGPARLRRGDDVGGGRGDRTAYCGCGRRLGCAPVRLETVA